MPTYPFLPFGPFHLLVVVTALAFMALEYALGRLAQHDTHDLGESAASLAVAAGQTLMRGIEAVLVAMPFAFVHAHRLLDFDQTGPLALLGLFVGSEFLYYWHHRAAHRIRWLWATHSVHHSATRLNLTAAVRLGWTGNISGNFLFFLPLVWIGFHPFAVVAMLGVNLFYQFFIHTEFGPKLGPLEWILNTPAHHRVHHASNAACLDKNYGGILIVFDRLFGTFVEAPEGQRLRYGLAGGTPTLNPMRIALGEWAAMIRDLRAAAGWKERFAALFAPPGPLKR
ncbi:sterol desaturase family protein [Labrys monachus]|uniref:Sterol desaturase/sphingolipid hydroxylase (Fatty acid hydroxylase superfamily) n=1 Tax=Labrys monachus TaxID=217067 RepID=A0ABU0FFI7_9HYPH|nr:sterol desaturase family protein [Labrys monachus]MDQ0393092.1 sterol desaturase/sphingolipid hydroxylase (fatty acid hydroxylase superfamily) [Labrys monachus]